MQVGGKGEKFAVFCSKLDKHCLFWRKMPTFVQTLKIQREAIAPSCHTVWMPMDELQMCVDRVSSWASE
jgi:hypothetical protein